MTWIISNSDTKTSDLSQILVQCLFQHFFYIKTNQRKNEYIKYLILFLCPSTLQNKIDRVTAELETWFNRKDLIINAGKTGVMSFHNRQPKFLVKPQVTFNKINLDCTAETKFLGIDVTETLKWNSHVQSLASKLSKVSFMIKSLKEIFIPNMIQNIYFIKFQSFLWFGILFGWGWGGELNTRILWKQKRVIRSMVGVSSRTSCGQLFKEMNILTLTSLHIYIGSDLFYKKIPPVCGAKFQCSYL